MAPLHGEQLVYLTPGGGFSFIFTLCIYFGALLTIPVAIYHIYRFLQPLLQSASRRFVATFIFLSGLLATAGTLFGYFVAIPAALNFLTTFAGDTVIPNLTADSYLGFVVAYVLGLAALFQIPLLLFLFDHIRPIPPGGLSSTQQYVIIGATVAAAIITPTPDAMNMAIIAVPIIVVYEIGAFAVFIRHQFRKKAAAKMAAKAVRQEQLRQKTVLQRQLAQEQEQLVPRPHSSVSQPSSSTPQAAHMVTARPPRRTMDGFITATRTSSTRVSVPMRPRPASRPIHTTRTVPGRPIRSLDGLSMV